MGEDTDLETLFPELSDIRDEDLRDKVNQVWDIALSETSWNSLSEVPRSPTKEKRPGGTTLISHIQDVTILAISIADTAQNNFNIDIDMDHLIAGAILHDISKLYEYSDERINNWFPHPHYALILFSKANMPLHTQHIVLAHSPLSAVEPQTYEAEIVLKADELAIHGLFIEHNGELYPHL